MSTPAEAAHARVKAMRPAVRRKVERLTVWCETSRCRIATVYKLTEGHLIVFTGETQIDELTGWRKARPQLLEEVLRRYNAGENVYTAYSLNCRCQNEPRSLDLVKLMLYALPDPQIRNRNLGDDTIR